MDNGTSDEKEKLKRRMEELQNVIGDLRKKNGKDSCPAKTTGSITTTTLPSKYKIIKNPTELKYKTHLTSLTYKAHPNELKYTKHTFEPTITRPSSFHNQYKTNSNKTEPHLVSKHKNLRALGKMQTVVETNAAPKKTLWERPKSENQPNNNPQIALKHKPLKSSSFYTAKSHQPKFECENKLLHKSAKVYSKPHFSVAARSSKTNQLAKARNKPLLKTEVDNGDVKRKTVWVRSPAKSTFSNSSAKSLRKQIRHSKFKFVKPNTVNFERLFLKNTTSLRYPASFERFNDLRRNSFYQRNSALRSRNSVYFVGSYASYYRRNVAHQTFAAKRFNAIRRRQTLIATSSHKVNGQVKDSPKALILTKHGANYEMKNNMKTLTKLNLPKTPKSKTTQRKLTRNITPKQHAYKLILSKSFTPVSKSAKRFVASRLLKNTLKKKNQWKKKNEAYCMFYNRFGKCKRGKECRYIHDPEKVAVCTRFLRGTCDKKDCLFSHKIDPNKMPVCSYYLLGQCSKDVCPYRHVNVSRSAPVCKDFLKGYCVQANKCPKKHILECEEFTETGQCILGKQCKLVHRVKLKKRASIASSSGKRKPRAYRRRKSSEANTQSSAASAITTIIPSFLKRDLSTTSNSLSVMRDLFSNNNKASEPAAEQQLPTTSDDVTANGVVMMSEQSDFIPLTCSSSEDSEEDLDQEHEAKITNQNSFTEKDFISLE